jgi:hypothetical protein
MQVAAKVRFPPFISLAASGPNLAFMTCAAEVQFEPKLTA